MARRLFLIFGLLLGLVVLLLALAVVFRLEVVRYLLDDTLEARGLDGLSYEVESVELESASLTAVAWQEGDRLSLNRITVSYDPWDLLSGEVQGITVEGLRLTLDLTGTGAPLEGLPIPAGGSEGTDGDGATAGGGAALPDALPPITLVDAQIKTETPAGPVEVELEGDILPDGVGGLAGAFGLVLAGELGRLEGSLSVTRDPDGLMTGAAVLEQGNLDLPGGSIGGLGGEFDFRVGGSEPPRVRGEFTLSGIEVPQQLFDAADLLVVLEDGQFLAEGLLRSPDRKAEARVKMTADSLFAEPLVKLDGSLRLEAGAALWPLLDLPQPSRGAARFQLAGEGTLPALERLTVRDGGLLAWLAAGDTRGRIEIRLADLAFPGAMQGLSGTTRLDWGLLQGVIVAGLTEDATLTAANLDPAWLVSLDLPPDTAAALAGGATLTLPAQAAADARLYLEPSAEGHLLDLAATLRLEATDGARAALAGVLTLDLSPTLEVVSLSLQGLALQAQELPLDGHVIGSLKIGGELEGTPAELEGDLGIQVTLLKTDLGDHPVEDLGVGGQFAAHYTDERLELVLQSDGQVSMGQFFLDGQAILTAPADGEVQSSDLALDWSSGDLILSHDTVAKLGEERLLFGEPGEGVAVEGDFGRFRLVGRTNAAFDYAATLGLSEVAVRLPSYGLFLGQTSVAWIFPFPDEADAPGRITVGDGAVTTALGRIGGLTLEAEATESETGIVLEGSGRGPGGVGRVSVRLEDDSATGKGGLTADWGPVTFKPGGLQPGQLLGFFSDFEEVGGKLRLLLSFNWTADRGSSAAKVTLTDISFHHPQLDAEGLDATIAFDRLAAISTRPGQKVTVRKLDIGMPITDVTASLQIKPGRETAYILSDLGFTLAGGRFTAPQLAFDPAQEQTSSTVAVDNLDLDLLVQELEIEDFAMEGKMSGSLPVAYRLSDEAISVTGGKLVNVTPGVIRYGQAGTASLRAGGDENFALALEALENFQYSTLDLTIDKEAEGSTRLYVILEGKNPDVLDGYPFRININLQTNLSQVLDALREGYRLNPDLFKGGWTFN